MTELPAYVFTTDAHGIAAQPPLEIRVSGVQEQQLSDLGIVPVTAAPYSTALLFNSNASLHQPARYDRDEATWNARISSMLQYVLCVSRFSHYLLVMIRDRVGGYVGAKDVERQLNAWLNQYCLGSDGATDEMRARFPLREASIDVREIAGRPGALGCTIRLQPPFPARQHRHQLPPGDRPGERTPLRKHSMSPPAEDVPAAIRAALAEGRLGDATAQLLARVRANPTDAAARSTLAELLCLAGAFDRAEAQLAVVAQQTVDRPVALARMRHLIRAAVAREAWFEAAAVPALLAEPSAAERAALALALALRAGDGPATAAALEAAENARPHLAGTMDGTPFDDIRDVDDRCAWFWEILTHDGHYMWTDLAKVEAVAFSAAAAADRSALAGGAADALGWPGR